jgi:hypothetical protein
MAQRLSPVQTFCLEDYRNVEPPLVEFSEEAALVRREADVLTLYGALTAKERVRLMDEGVPVDALRGPALAAAVRLLLRRAQWVFGDGDQQRPVICLHPATGEAVGENGLIKVHKSGCWFIDSNANRHPSAIPCSRCNPSHNTFTPGGGAVR